MTSDSNPGRGNGFEIPLDNWIGPPDSYATTHLSITTCLGSRVLQFRWDCLTIRVYEPAYLTNTTSHMSLTTLPRASWGDKKSISYLNLRTSLEGDEPGMYRCQTFIVPRWRSLLLMLSVIRESRLSFGSGRKERLRGRIVSLVNRCHALSRLNAISSQLSYDEKSGEFESTPALQNWHKKVLQHRSNPSRSGLMGYADLP